MIKASRQGIPTDSIMATPPSTPPSGGKARALPADFDVTDKRSRVKPTRDFHTGVRNNVVVSKKPSRYGYKLYVMKPQRQMRKLGTKWLLILRAR